MAINKPDMRARRDAVLPRAVAAVLVCATSVSYAGAALGNERDKQIAAANFLMQARAEQVIDARRICASGQAPEVAIKARSLGADGVPDASDDCPVALARIAKDGGLTSLYDALVSDLSGDPSVAQTLPAAIGVAVTKAGATVVAIGNQRAARISSALALDAGFTVAHQRGVKFAAGMPDLATLKVIAERCFAQKESNLGLCYSTGFVYGARAVSQLPLVQK